MSTTWLCKVLHLHQGDAKHKYRAKRMVESSPEEKHLGCRWIRSSRRAGNELGQARKPKKSWSSKSSVGSRLREVILHLHSGETLPAVLHPALGSHYRRMWTCWSESREGHGDDLRLEHLCYGDRLRELGLFSLEQKRFWGDIKALSSP